MSEIDIFVSSTGVITLDHMRKLNDVTLVGNTEHFDNEIDFAGSELGHQASEDYFSPERAVQVNVSPCFSGCSRPEHSTVRCPGVSRHEQAHRLMGVHGLIPPGRSELMDSAFPDSWRHGFFVLSHKSSSVSGILGDCIPPVYKTGIVSCACRGVDPLSSTCLQIWSALRVRARFVDTSAVLWYPVHIGAVFWPSCLREAAR